MLECRLRPPVAKDTKVLSPEEIRSTRALIAHHHELERIRHQAAVKQLTDSEARLQGYCIHATKETVPGFADMDPIQICQDCGKAWS